MSSSDRLSCGRRSCVCTGRRHNSHRLNERSRNDPYRTAHDRFEDFCAYALGYCARVRRVISLFLPSCDVFFFPFTPLWVMLDYGVRLRTHDQRQYQWRRSQLHP